MDTLGRLRAAGLTVEVVGAQLRVSPADRLTDDLRTLIRRNRTRLLLALQPEPRCGAGVRPAEHAPSHWYRSCRCCGRWAQRKACRACVLCMVPIRCYHCGRWIRVPAWAEQRRCRPWDEDAA